MSTVLLQGRNYTTPNQCAPAAQPSAPATQPSGTALPNFPQVPQLATLADYLPPPEELKLVQVESKDESTAESKPESKRRKVKSPPAPRDNCPICQNALHVPCHEDLYLGSALRVEPAHT